MSNSNTRLARLESALLMLEKAAGLGAPEYETVTQREDGSWPEPQTDAALVVERVRFRGVDPDVKAARLEAARLQQQVEAERRAFTRLTHDTPYAASPRGYPR